MKKIEFDLSPDFDVLPHHCPCKRVACVTLVVGIPTSSPYSEETCSHFKGLGLDMSGGERVVLCCYPQSMEFISEKN